MTTEAKALERLSNEAERIIATGSLEQLIHVFLLSCYARIFWEGVPLFNEESHLKLAAALAKNFAYLPVQFKEKTSEAELATGSLAKFQTDEDFWPEAENDLVTFEENVVKGQCIVIKES